jgi:hypothetical protein
VISDIFMNANCCKGQTRLNTHVDIYDNLNELSSLSDDVIETAETLSYNGHLTITEEDVGRAILDQLPI